VLWRWGLLEVNATVIYTWLVMALLVVGAKLVTRRLSADAKISRGQNPLEVLVSGIMKQIQEISQQPPGPTCHSSARSFCLSRWPIFWP